MRMPDLILKKRNGQSLSSEELAFVLDGYLAGRIPDYQVSALLMAIYFRGMTPAETATLTELMAQSGDQLDLSTISGMKVDKHSTGGVGDKTTLVVMPLVAAAGVKIAKLSGRGLGHTGGTIDKIEAIPGFSCDLTEEAFLEQGRTLGLVLGGQTGNMVPADKLLYALRDVTATVDSIPLIAASVMSKKLAAGADAIVLDVKCGSGAFMKTLDEARQLAEQMVSIGEAHGRPTTALITSMDAPLGRAVGNAIEVNEALAVLRGHGPEELTTLCVLLATELIYLARPGAASRVAIEQEVRGLIASGDALAVFRKWIRYQGGDGSFADDSSGGLALACVRSDYLATSDGYLRFRDTEAVGLAAMHLGAGREDLADHIDPGAGLYLRVLTGEYVESGQTIASLYTSDASLVQSAMEALDRAIVIETSPTNRTPLILDRVSNR